MAAGLNIKIAVWRITNEADDVVGGSVVTGTVSGYYNARMQANPDQQLLLQQGLETDRTFSMVVQPGTADIRERDEIQVVEPYDHPYHDKRFRIRSMRYSDLNPRDPRNYIMLTLSRSVRAHERQ